MQGPVVSLVGAHQPTHLARLWPTAALFRVDAAIDALHELRLCLKRVLQLEPEPERRVGVALPPPPPRGSRLDEVRERHPQGHSCTTQVLENLTWPRQMVQTESRHGEVLADEGREPLLRSTLSFAARNSSLSIVINKADVADYMAMAHLTAAQAREVVHVKMVEPLVLTWGRLPGTLERGDGTINVAGMIAFTGPAPSSVMPRRATYGGAPASSIRLRALRARVRSGCSSRSGTERRSRRASSQRRLPPDSEIHWRPARRRDPAPAIGTRVT